MNNKILVIGATGKVGEKLIRLLAQRGETVKAATRTPQNYKTPSPQVEPVYFDYDDPESFKSSLKDVNRIFMLAIPADTMAYERLTPFIDTAKSMEVPHIVMLTAMGIEYAEEAPLRKIEKYIEGSGVPWTFIRPNWFMDNFNTGFTRSMILETKKIFLPVGEAKISFIAAQDIAAVAAVVLTEAGHQGKAYTITGSQSLTYREAAQILSEAAGYPIEYVPITDDAMRQSMSAAGFNEAQLELFSKLYKSVHNGFAEATTPTVEHFLRQKPLSLKSFAVENANSWHQ